MWIFEEKIEASIERADELGLHKGYAYTIVLMALIALALVPLGAFITVSFALLQHNRDIALVRMVLIATIGVSVVALSGWTLWTKGKYLLRSIQRWT